MSARKAHSRQMKLLARIAKIGRYRVGEWVDLSAVKADLEMGREGIIDSTSPDRLSDTAYDLRALQDQGLLKFEWREWKEVARPEGKAMDPARPALAITQEAMVLVRDYEEGWISKAIAKQPITAVQVGVAALQLVVASTWFIWLLTWTLRLANRGK